MKINKMYQKPSKKEEKKRNTNLQKLYVIVFFLCVVIYVFQMSQNMNNVKSNPKLFLEGERKLLNRNILIEEKLDSDKNNQNSQNNTEKNTEHNVYLSLEDIKEIFNENILYNEKKGQIILISKLHVAQYNIKDLNGIFDGKKVKFEDGIKIKDGIPYISINELKKIYNFDVDIFKNNISVFRKEKNLTVLKLKEDTKLKSKDNMFAGTIATISKDKTIKKISETKNKYKVITDNNLIGYISKKYVESEIKVREEENDNNTINNNKHYITNFDSISKNYDEVKKEENKENICLISNFKILENGKIKVKYNFEDKGYQVYYNKILKEELIPYGKIELKKEDKINIVSQFEEFEKRNELINNIIEQVNKFNLKGIALDIEEIKDEALFTRIILELKPRLEQLNIKLVLPQSTTFIPNIDKKVDGIY